MKATKRTLILDYKKWICGGGLDEFDEKTATGYGDTALLNYNGYMCCLGQFGCQLGIYKDDMLNLLEPSSLQEEYVNRDRLLSEPEIKLPKLLVYREGKNSAFSSKAIKINDNEKTTITEKVKKLKSLCLKYNINLKLKNFPKKVLKELKEGQLQNV